MTRELTNESGVLVGFGSESHLGGALHRAGKALSLDVDFVNVEGQARIPRMIDRLSLAVTGSAPLMASGLESEVLACLSRNSSRKWVLFAGLLPMSKGFLPRLRSKGVSTACFLSDDPWNVTNYPYGDLTSLRGFDVLFTPRKANLLQLKDSTNERVLYVPFGYDPDLMSRDAELTSPEMDVIFVGGADLDRMALLAPVFSSGLKVGLVGGAWNRYEIVRKHSLGVRPIAEVNSLTKLAKVSICAVRRANRDGHVMRSFELGALGVPILAEWSEEHEEIFGADRDCVWYFRGPEDLREKAMALCGNIDERNRLACKVKARILSGRNRYQERLYDMLTFLGADQNIKTAPNSQASSSPIGSRP